MITNGTWTDEAVLRESERWVHVPWGGVCVEDERRLLVHGPERSGISRVWRTRVAERDRVIRLVEETVAEVRVAGRTRLVWHTGDTVAPPFVDECLAACGFRVSQELRILAFEMGKGPEARLPRLGSSASVRARIARDASDLREATRVDSEVFSVPEPSEEALARFSLELEKLSRCERRSSVEDGSLVLRFVAEVKPRDDLGAGREIIASAGAEVVGETVRLWGAGTLQSFRRRGAYGALVVERCRTAHALGASLALTKANTHTSAPLLERAGFRSVGVERRQVLEIR